MKLGNKGSILQDRQITGVGGDEHSEWIVRFIKMVVTGDSHKSRFSTSHPDGSELNRK